MAASAPLRVTLLCAGLVVLALTVARISAASAQTLPPAAAEIAHCACLRQAVDVLGRDMAARQQALEQTRQELARIDAELESERARMNVDDPAQVARFRQLLGRRDALFRNSTGAVIAALRAAVDRYNASVNEYNARCANRPQSPELQRWVQPSLRCPPLY